MIRWLHAEHLVEAQNLAVAQFAVHLRYRQGSVPEEEALSFLSREILRLNRDGEADAHRLADRAISMLREHIQKRESALRIARPADPD